DQKCPVVLVLDTSGSMSGNPIDELNKALVKLKEDILSDPILTQRLEVGIVCFDDDARVERPIDLITVDTNMPSLDVGGVTNVVSGINKAIEIVEERKQFYKTNGEQYYRPFIVLFTDGAPTNTADEIEMLDQQIQQMADNKKFVFMPFGVEGADFQLLAKLAVQSTDERLKNQAKAWKLKDVTKFAEVFAFVSSSISGAINQGGSQTAQLSSDVAQSVTFDLGS
ncbi:MAG: vWA domain-containing protein, partial [Sphingobacteriales bacterium]